MIANPATSADKEPNILLRAAQFEEELLANFGPAAMQPERSGYDQISRSDLRIMRGYYTHAELMTGTAPKPTGYGMLGAISAAAEAIGTIIQAAAPFIGMIPGIGMGVSMAITAGAGLAAGDRIDKAAIDTISVAVPKTAKKSFDNAVAIGYAAARGQRVDEMLVDAGRREAERTGGPQAAAAFDAGIAIGSGQGLQDAGFLVLGTWVKGADTPVARALQFGLDVKAAAERGMTVGDFLLDQAKKEFLSRIPVAHQALMLKEAIEFFLAHPEQVLNPQMADLANRLSIPIEAIRAAIICIRRMADGTITVDRDFEKVFRSPLIKESTTAGPSVIQAQGVIPMVTVKTLGRLPSADIRERNAALAAKGALMASNNATIAASRALDPDANYKRGHDIGTATCEGSSIPGGGQDAIRDSIGPYAGGTAAAVKGFLVAQALQHGITKIRNGAISMSVSSNPGVAAGQLVTAGVAGSGNTSDQKASTMAALTGSPATKAGAVSAIAVNEGFWVKLKRFFGL